MTKSSSRKPTSPCPISEDYRQLLEEMYSPGQWFRSHKSFPLVMSLDECYFLSYLAGVSDMLKAYEKNDGWFYHTNVQIEEEIYIPKWKQDRLFEKLKKRGFIETKKEGMPVTRYIRINYIKLRKAILKKREERVIASEPEPQQPEVAESRRPEVANSRRLESANSRRYNRHSTLTGTEEKKKDKEVARPKRRDDTSTSLPSGGLLGSKTTPKELPLKNQWANLLQERLRKAGKITCTPSTTWPTQFVKLQQGLVDSGLELIEANTLIDKVLRWYVDYVDKHGSEDYAIRAWSAKGFRDKFDSIRNKMEESTKKEKPVDFMDQVVEGYTRREWRARNLLPPDER